MDIIEKVKEGIQQLIQLALLLIPLAIVIQILFGNVHKFAGSDAVGNLIGLLDTLGKQGLIGLITLGLVLWFFSMALAPSRRGP